MTSANEDLVRRGYAALSADDVDGWLELVAVDAELHELDEIPGTDVYRGHDGLRTWATEVRELTEECWWMPEEIVAEAGEAMVVRVRFKALGAGSGITYEEAVFHAIEFRDGKLGAFRGFRDLARALEAAGLEK